MSTASSTPTPQRGPGRPPAGTSQGESVRDRLLDAATALAVEQGFDACGLREIAARAGVSSGMVSYYFGDRDGLHDAMFQRALERASEQVARLLADGEHTLDTLDAFVRLHVGILAADPWIPQFIAREVLGGDSGRRGYVAHRVGGGPLRMLVNWIEAGVARGELRADLDPQLAALSLASIAIFPFIILPVIGAEFGLTLEQLSPERLIEHNRSLLNLGMRAREDDA